MNPETAIRRMRQTIEALDSSTDDSEIVHTIADSCIVEALESIARNQLTGEYKRDVLKIVEAWRRLEVRYA